MSACKFEDMFIRFNTKMVNFKKIKQTKNKIKKVQFGPLLSWEFTIVNDVFLNCVFLSFHFYQNNKNWDKMNKKKSEKKVEPVAYTILAGKKRGNSQFEKQRQWAINDKSRKRRRKKENDHGCWLFAGTLKSRRVCDPLAQLTPFNLLLSMLKYATESKSLDKERQVEITRSLSWS